MRRSLPILFTLLAGSTAALRGQSLTVYSGNGQIVLEQFLTTVPMKVLARDGRGNPAPNIPITWTITQGQGTIVRPMAQTDASGFATADFLGTAIPFGLTYTQATVTASSSYGPASFFVTTTLVRSPSGGTASLPLVDLLNPPPDKLLITGRAGAILPGAIQVRVAVGSVLLPNVGVNMHYYNEEEQLPAPFAQCRGGEVLTNSLGVATCDLILNDQVGQVQISAVAGEMQKTRPMLLNITQGTPCAYSIAPGGQAFATAGGAGTIVLTTGSGCAWAAASSANWVVLSGAVAGSGSANISFAVATNAGPTRSATITIGSQVFNISQAAAGTTASPLTISTSSPLSQGTVGTAYSQALQATGGTPPYQWAASNLPPGLLLNGAIISGTPTTAGSYSLSLTLTDGARGSITQSFAVTVGTTPISTGGPVLTNGSFPAAAVGQAYRQAVTFTTSCTSPFGQGPTIAVSSGSLPPGITLTSPVEKTWVLAGTPTNGGSYNFALTITEVCGRTGTASFLLPVSGAGSGGGGGSAGAITPSQQQISFTVGAGSAVRPGDVIVGLTSSNGSALAYTATIQNMTGGAWLSITNGATGLTPSSLTLSAGNFQTFAAGTYTAQLALQTNGNATVIVPVTLTVTTAAPVSVSPMSLVFTTPTVQAPTFMQQSVQITASAATHFTVNFINDSQSNWLGVTPGAGDTPATITVLANPVGLRPGTFTGRITITPSVGAPVSVPVSLVVTAPPVFSWSIPSADNSYLTNGPAPSPLTVNLASSGSNLQFQLTNPAASWLSVTPRQGITPTNITLTFDPSGLAPGVYQTVITASAIGTASQPLTLPVTLSVRQAAPTISAVLHGASFLPALLAPGLEVLIVGSNLGPSTQADSMPDPDTGLYPTSLQGARILFDDYAAPILHASDQQVTVLVPYSVAGKADVRVVSEYRFAQSIPQRFNVADTSPGIFTGAGSQAIVLNEDGSYNSQTAGANPGSVIGILGTGAGQTDPAGIDGLLTQDGAAGAPLMPVTAQIGGLNAEVISAAPAPGQPAGVFLIKVRIPDDAPRGTVVPLSVSVGSASTQDGVTIVIAP